MHGLTNVLLYILNTHTTLLAALISVQTLQNILKVIGYPAVSLFIMIESILWAIIYGTLGYVAGRFLTNNFTVVERIASTLGWIGAAIIVVFAAALFILLRLRRHKRMLAAIEREVEADAPDVEEQAASQQISNEPVSHSNESTQINVESESAPGSAGLLQK